MSAQEIKSAVGLMNDCSPQYSNHLELDLFQTNASSNLYVKDKGVVSKNVTLSHDEDRSYVGYF